MESKYIPGTVIEYSPDVNGYSAFAAMVDAAGGFSLSQICAVTGLEGSTIQNWIKRGFVPHPTDKKYGHRQICRILLISTLRDSMKIDDIGLLMHVVNGDTDDESDDIISERALYDYLCEIIGRLDCGVVPSDGARDIISEVCAPFCAENTDKAGNCLMTALTVMVKAYFSGRLRREAYEMLGLLTEEK